MLTHIVLIRLKDKSEESMQIMKEKLLGLKAQIPFLRFIEVGTDIIHSERSYDVALYTKFDTIMDMEAYQVHPAHVKVLEYIKTTKESSVAIDYES